MISQEIKNLIPKICEFMKSQPITKVWLFGSCSRGEETEESDLDLLVNYDPSARISLLKICGIMVSLEDIIRRPVDLIEERGLLQHARFSADRDKILIYERTD